MSHEMSCSSGVGQRCTCKAIRAERRPQPRDTTALFAKGSCVLCASTELTEAHAATHLANGSAVVQYAKASEHWRMRILPTADVPLTDQDGVSVFEHDGDKWDRTDANAEHLRSAILKARLLSKQTAKAIALARKKAGL